MSPAGPRNKDNNDDDESSKDNQRISQSGPRRELGRLKPPADALRSRKAHATEPDHPLKFLLDEKGKFKSQRGLKHHELIDRPDIIQIGHMISNKLRGTEYLMLQGAWENQWSNLTIETSHLGGAVLEQTAIDICGIAVDKKTATFWEEIGWLKAGTVETAPIVVLE